MENKELEYRLTCYYNRLYNIINNVTIPLERHFIGMNVEVPNIDPSLLFTAVTNVDNDENYIIKVLYLPVIRSKVTGSEKSMCIIKPFMTFNNSINSTLVASEEKKFVIVAIQFHKIISETQERFDELQRLQRNGYYPDVSSVHEFHSKVDFYKLNNSDTICVTKDSLFDVVYRKDTPKWYKELF